MATLGEEVMESVLVWDGERATFSTDKSRNSSVRILFRNIEVNTPQKRKKAVECGCLWGVGNVGEGESGRGEIRDLLHKSYRPICLLNFVHFPKTFRKLDYK